MASRQPRAPAMAGGASGILSKTKLCRFFASAGRCPRGAGCTFAHGEGELRQQPSLYKTRMCEEFLRVGACPAGEACSFAHGREERRRIIMTKKGPTAVGEEAYLSARQTPARRQQPQPPHGQSQRCAWEEQPREVKEQEDDSDVEVMRLEIQNLQAQLRALQASIPGAKGAGAAAGLSCVSTYDAFANLPNLPTTPSECSSSEGYSCCEVPDADIAKAEAWVGRARGELGVDAADDDDDDEAVACDILVKNSFITLVPRATAVARARARSSPPCRRDARAIGGVAP